MKNFLQVILRLCVIIIGFSCFLSFSRLLVINEASYALSFSGWYHGFSSIFMNLSDFSYFHTFFETFTTNTQERYLYTMKLFGFSLCLVIVCSIVLTFLYYLSPPKLKTQIRNLVNFSESTPDLLVILLFITFVIFLFKTTGLKFLQLYGFNTEPFVIPIIVISYLPVAFFTEYLIQLLEDEKNKDYVILAKAKGLTLESVFFNHILKNVLPLSMPYLRKIMIIILSNIVLVENILKIQGFTADLYRIFTAHPLMIVANFVLFALPLILLELVIRLYSLRGKGASTL